MTNITSIILEGGYMAPLRSKADAETELAKLSLKGKRLGEVAYDIHGNVLKNCWPVFALKEPA